MQTTPAPIEDRVLAAIGTRNADVIRVVGYYGRKGEIPHWFMCPVSPDLWGKRGEQVVAKFKAEVARSIAMETTIELCGPDMEHGVEVFWPAHVARAAA